MDKSGPLSINGLTRGGARARANAMKQPPQDRRSLRTREALRGAFIRLVLAQGYDAMGVADIAEAANVGRSTFYQHYSGKLAVLKDTLQYPSRPLAQIVGAGITADALVPQLLHFRDQRQRNRPFLIEPMRGVWTRVLAGLIEPRLAAMARGRRCLLPMPLAATQIAEAQLGLIIGWLTARSAVKPADMAQALVRTTDALTQALLDG